MDIGEPIKSLGPVDMEALRERILAREESAWYEQKLRQNEYDIHRYTQSMVLVFTDGSGWPNIEVSKEPGWARLVEQGMPLMHGSIYLCVHTTLRENLQS